MVAVTLGPPVLLGRVELLGDLRVAFERQHAGKRFAVGHGAVPAVVDRGLEDLDDLRGEKAWGTQRVRQHVHVGAGAGHVVRPTGVWVGVDVEGQAGRGQPTEPDLGRPGVRLGALEHRLRGGVARGRAIREGDEILGLPRFGLTQRCGAALAVRLGDASRERDAGRQEYARGYLRAEEASQHDGRLPYAFFFAAAPDVRSMRKAVRTFT